MTKKGEESTRRGKDGKVEDEKRYQAAAPRSPNNDKNTNSGGPRFKDQAQARRAAPTAPGAVERRNLCREAEPAPMQNPPRGGSSGEANNSDNPSFGPSYKDQCRPYFEPKADTPYDGRSRRQPDTASEEDILTDPPSLRQSSGVAPDDTLSASMPDDSTFLVKAHVVDEHVDSVSSPPRDSIYTAQAVVGGVFVSRRRVLLFVAALLIVTAAVLGGVCGTGNCGGSGKAETTDAPTPSPTPPPTITPRAAAILDYINNVSFSANPIRYPVPVGDVATTEERAVEWLIEDDPLELSVERPGDVFSLTQRYSLATLYFGTNGEFWDENEGWLLDEDECMWFHVDCADDGFTIQQIDLSDNSLHGVLSADVGLLSSPTEVYLDINPNLGGTLPDSVGSWELLGVFDVSKTDLTGPLPSGMANWGALRQFSASETRLSGLIPDWIGNWSSLRTFQCGGSNFSGPLPQSMGQWSALSW